LTCPEVCGEEYGQNVPERMTPWLASIAEDIPWIEQRIRDAKVVRQKENLS
jgi:hypothetical protein